MSLDLDVTYVLVLALFLLPLVVLNALVFRPFMRLFEARHERLQGAVERAEQMIADAEERACAFEREIQAATSRGIEARNGLRADAVAELNARLEGEQKKLASKVSAALGELSKKRAIALDQIRAEAKQMAEVAATKLLGREI